MKAIQFQQYGAPDKVLKLVEIDKPIPGDNQVLIKVHAAATNPLDWHRMEADPFIVRFGEGFFKPDNPGLGADIAGVVEAIGNNVTEFEVGDRVLASIGSGGFAEYALAATKNTVTIPETVSFIDAASSPVVGLTAIQGLRDSGNIQAGQSVLLNGASGGVGSFAVQYAKAMGAEVTGVCSGRNVELVKSIGADHVIDYTKDDFTRTGDQYDIIYDAVGNRSVWAYQRALKPDGKCVMAGFTTLPHMFHVIAFGGFVASGNQSISPMPIAKTTKDDLILIRDLLASGKVKAVIDRCYSLEETPQAIAYLETGRARGKVIITIQQV